MKKARLAVLLLQIATVVVFSLSCKRETNDAFSKVPPRPKYWDTLSPAQKEYYENMNPGQKTALEAYPTTIEQKEAFIKLWRRHTGQRD